jgi:predicted RNA-binding protein with TRAM domain
MRENRFSRVAPVSEGDELDVKIEALGDKGDGIAKKNGFVLVVPNTQVNDEVRIRVTKVLRKVGFAEVIGKKEPSEEQAQEEPAEESSEEPAEEETSEDSSEEQSQDSEDFGGEEEP